MLVDDIVVSGLRRWVSRSGADDETVREGLAASILKRQLNTAVSSNEARHTLLGML